MRPGASGDVDALARIVAEAFRPYEARMERKPAPMLTDFGEAVSDGSVWAAEHEGDIVGFVICYPVGDEMHLETVAVAPAHQGKGVGRALIEHAEIEARQRKLGTVALYTNVCMTENLGLYAVLGYEETERRTEDGFDRVFFRKTI
ncbi:MAG: GNAT family N-acetyltransferase [Pseudomonadota bacterium]